jgi:hypothetical protein
LRPDSTGTEDNDMPVAQDADVWTAAQLQGRFVHGRWVQELLDHSISSDAGPKSHNDCVLEAVAVPDDQNNPTFVRCCLKQIIEARLLVGR